jgi:UDP-N-acetylmuramoyl-tripeptide--D-alanyl-D-alanine ligase
VIPDGEDRMDPYIPAGVEIVRFGRDGAVLDGLELPSAAAHMRMNAMAAVAAARAVGVEPAGRVEVELSAMRGQRVEVPGGATVVEDCYNANPLSMRAALDDLAASSPSGRRIAVLGDMLELGPTERDLHRAVGAYAAQAGVDVLVTVGDLAAEMAPAFGGESHVVASAEEAAALVPGLVGPGDLVLVKASRGVALEAVTEALRHG